MAKRAQLQAEVRLVQLKSCLTNLPPALVDVLLNTQTVGLEILHIFFNLIINSSFKMSLWKSNTETQNRRQEDTKTAKIPINPVNVQFFLDGQECRVNGNGARLPEVAVEDSLLASPQKLQL